MMARLATGLAVGLAATLLASAGAAMANGGGPFDIDSDLQTRTITWKDQESETSYRVSGRVIYMNFSCDPAHEGIPGETHEFSEELPADTTSFRFPPAEHDDVLSVKDLEFTIEALDVNGDVLEQDGFALIVDGLFCPDGTLPSTGASLGSDGSGQARILALLAVVLLSSLASLALAWRRA